jgi:hypothetical protein
MKRITALFSLAALTAAVLVLSSTAIAQGDIDQEDGDIDATGGQGASALPAGQTFIPSQDRLAAFDIGLAPPFLSDKPATFTFQVTQWPAGPVLTEFQVELTQGQMPCEDVHEGGGGACHIAIPSGALTLTPGEKYAILITKRVSVPASNRYVFWSGTKPYDNGCFVGAGQEMCEYGDVYFKTYVNEPQEVSPPFTGDGGLLPFRNQPSNPLR